jgi:hypothetical protein
LEKIFTIRTFLAGLLGGLTLNLMMFLTFRLLGFGLEGDGILLDSSLQSFKLIAVWTEIEPIPLVVSNPIPIMLGLLLFGFWHSFIYKWISPNWPRGIKARTWRISLLIFFIYLFWEFFSSIQFVWRTNSLDFTTTGFLVNNSNI